MYALRYNLHVRFSDRLMTNEIMNNLIGFGAGQR